MNRKVEIVIEDIDERTVELARTMASREGLTLDEMVERYLSGLASRHERGGDGETPNRPDGPDGPNAG